MTRHNPFRSRFVQTSLGCLVLIVAAGCGGPKMATVVGTVTYNGDPITGGTLLFGPVAAKGDANPGAPATAKIQSDGSFKLGTYRPGDGAIVGRHRIVFTPPTQELSEEQRHDPRYIAPLPPYMGLHPRAVEVDVKRGVNQFTIELVRTR